MHRTSYLSNDSKVILSLVGSVCLTLALARNTKTVKKRPICIIIFEIRIDIEKLDFVKFYKSYSCRKRFILQVVGFELQSYPISFTDIFFNFTVATKHIFFNNVNIVAQWVDSGLM